MATPPFCGRAHPRSGVCTFAPGHEGDHQNDNGARWSDGVWAPVKDPASVAYDRGVAEGRAKSIAALEEQATVAHERARALRQQADDSELAAHGFDVAAAFLRRIHPPVPHHTPGLSPLGDAGMNAVEEAREGKGL